MEKEKRIIAALLGGTFVLFCVLALLPVYSLKAIGCAVLLMCILVMGIFGYLIFKYSYKIVPVILILMALYAIAMHATREENKYADYTLKFVWESETIELDKVSTSFFYKENDQWVPWSISNMDDLAPALSEEVINSKNVALNMAGLSEQAGDTIELYAVEIYCGKYKVGTLDAEDIVNNAEKLIGLSFDESLSEQQSHTSLIVKSDAQIVLGNETLKYIKDVIEGSGAEFILLMRDRVIVLSGALAIFLLLKVINEKVNFKKLISVYSLVIVVGYLLGKNVISPIILLLACGGGILFVLGRIMQEPKFGYRAAILLEVVILLFSALNTRILKVHDYTLELVYSYTLSEPENTINCRMEYNNGFKYVLADKVDNDTSKFYAQEDVFHNRPIVFTFSILQPDSKTIVEIEQLNLYDSGIWIKSISGEELINSIYSMAEVSEMYTDKGNLYIAGENVNNMQLFLNYALSGNLGNSGRYYYALVINSLFIGIIVVSGLYFITELKKKLQKAIEKYAWSNILIKIVYLVILSFSELLFVEFLSNGSIQLGAKEIGGNLILYFWINLLIMLCSNIIISASVTSVACLVIGIANKFTLLYRGTPIMPWDVYSVGTALNVAGQYELKLEWDSIYCIAGLLLIGIGGICIAGRMRRSKEIAQRLPLHIVLIAATLLVGYMMFNTETINKMKYKENVYMQKENYKANGWLLATRLNLKYIKIEKPEEFSESKVEQLLSDYEETLGKQQEQPHIVIILNESFSDIQSFCDVETDKEVMPFIDSLEGSNVSKGTCYVSQRGGGTCNTEYELLMGNTMAFMPSGSIVFQQHMSSEQYSLINILNKKGYKTIGMHPMPASNWERDSAYPKLRFQEMTFYEDLEDLEYIRSYTSDKYCYDWIIEQFENKKEGEKLAIYNLTVQNHGGYLDEKYVNTVNVLNDSTIDGLGQYLSLMRESDQALEGLLHYFENSDEEVVVLFMGDHQPGMDLSALKTGTSWQDDFGVPYVLWNNYGMDMEVPEKISVNYMASYLLKNCGISRSKYYQFLEELSKKIPIVDTSGYTDTEGNDYRWGSDAYIEELNDYKILQYGLNSTEINDKAKYYE